MNRKISILLLILACLMALAGCQCEHEWKDADCTNAKTCNACGETEGEALGHTWADADCITAKTCKTCGATEGEALGHTWADATCTAPKTCTVCAATEGEVLEHTWADATCTAPKTCTVCTATEGDTLEHTWIDATTEAPKTCAVCAATEGERIITDPRFTTAAAAPVFGTWSGTVTGDMLKNDEVPAGLEVYLTMTFHNDGTLSATMQFDKQNYIDAMLPLMIETMYSQFASMGMDQASADEAMKAQYGMTVPEYVAYAFEQMNESDLHYEIDTVYYVEDGQIYVGSDWDEEMTPGRFTLDGDTLTIIDDEETGAEISLSRLKDE